jgi:integrase
MRRIEAPTKGRRSRRVALSDTLVVQLERWYEESRPDSDAYVWPGKDGGPMHDRSVGRAVERACHRAGLVDAEGKPLTTPHRLRHTAASIMLAEGVPLMTVSRQLGHANPNITAQVYAHLLADDQLDAAAAAFNRPRATDTGEQTGERRARNSGKPDRN